jgi:phosphate transport system substrate-binding protein
MTIRITVQVFLGFIFVSFSPLLTATTVLNGSGATFPAPLYQRWGSEFHKAHPEITLNYQGVGSGAGVRDFTNKLTDFCGSDVPLKPSELAKLDGNAIAIPAAAGTIALAYNIPGLTKLRLSREAAIDIFLGKITLWNDPLIVKNNPEVTLPSLPITVVTRSEGSGTTALFTEYFSYISDEFDKKIGSGKSVTWPVGLAGKGSDGVTSLIKQTRGSIGFMEFGFAQGRLSIAELENKSGAFVAPSAESGASALAGWNQKGEAYDPAGSTDYPITGVTWLFLRKEYTPEKGTALKEFLKYVLSTGQQLAAPLGYIGLPANITDQSLKALEEVK